MNLTNSFNLTDFLFSVINNAVTHTELFSHINTGQMLVCLSTNKGSGGGIYGKLVPMRFKNGEEIIEYKKKYYAIPHVFNNNMKILYIIYFYMPKFFDLPPDDKLNVIFHELFHINPSFNGDIRRMGKVKSAHGFSKRHFDSHFHDSVIQFKNKIRSSEIYSILSMNTDQLYGTYGKIIARKMKMPRPVIINNKA